MTNKIVIKRKIMGGFFTVQTWANDNHSKKISTKLINLALDRAVEIERKLTDFYPSPFNQINENAGIKPVEVDTEILNLILRANKISQDTEGAFDISYASVGHLWRKARQNGILPQKNEIDQARFFINYKLIEINERAQTVYLPDRRMKIGLGGIGKGYAVDKVYEYLLENGLSNFLVDGSGDIRVQSAKDAPRDWTLGIKNPFSKSEKTVGFVKLKEGSLATSGDYNQYIKNLEEDRKYHHIINPEEGYPSVDFASVTLIGSTTIETDTYATALMTMTKTKALKIIERIPMKAILIETNGKVLLNKPAYQMLKGAA